MKKLLLICLFLSEFIFAQRSSIECEKSCLEFTNLIISEKWRKMSCGLHKNKNGEIGFESLEMFCDFLGREYYITEISNLKGNNKIKNTIDTLTFHRLDHSFFKDKNHVYQFIPSVESDDEFRIFEDIDVQSFEVLSYACFRDKNNIYNYKGVILGIDVQSFEILNKMMYFRDKNNIYNNEGAVIDADYKTFRTFNSDIAKDKFSYLSSGVRIKETDYYFYTYRDRIKEFEQKLLEYQKK